MSIIATFVLPEDVILKPVDELPREVSGRVDHRPGDYVVTRPRSRTPSMVVDAQSAGLLKLFRQPSTIVDAVIRYRTAERLDPRETLQDVFPVLQRFLNADLLVSSHSEIARPIEYGFKPGEAVGDFRIAAPIDVVLDTEVYMARAQDGAFVALKVARSGSEPQLKARLSYEAAVLDRLDGSVTPRLLAVAETDGRPFIALSWCRGMDAYSAAAEARKRGHEGRDVLFTIMERIVEAYAHLHSQGVLHGDVHPRNVLVDDRQRVTLIDFGFAQSVGGDTLGNTRRGIVDLYMEPELAQARRTSVASPTASVAGEQYSVAAMLYLLVTGVHTHRFVLEEAEMLRQVIEDPPLAFREPGIHELPQIERTLQNALAKTPAARFSDLDTFLRNLRAALCADRKLPWRQDLQENRQSRLLFVHVLERLSSDGSPVGTRLKPPTSSFHNGAAGIAYTLLRIARIRDDDRLLALADLWSNRPALGRSWRGSCAVGSPARR